MKRTACLEAGRYIMRLLSRFLHNLFGIISFLLLCLASSSLDVNVICHLLEVENTDILRSIVVCEIPRSIYSMSHFNQCTYSAHCLCSVRGSRPCDRTRFMLGTWLQNQALTQKGRLYSLLLRGAAGYICFVCS